jgi:prepilin-type processing-associated H-X9-DG protein
MTNATPPREGRLVKILVLVGIVALVVSLAVPSLNRRREQQLAWLAQRKCPHTIGGIGILAQMYGNDNGGAVPPDLDALQRYARKESGGDITESFICPYAKARGVAPKQKGAVCMSSFVYVVPACVTHYSQIKHPGETVCAYEPLEDHGLGTPVLYWDGHSTWYDAAEARRIIDEVTAGHNPPRPTQPAGEASDEF